MYKVNPHSTPSLRGINISKEIKNNKTFWQIVFSNISFLLYIQLILTLVLKYASIILFCKRKWPFIRRIYFHLVNNLLSHKKMQIHSGIFFWIIFFAVKKYKYFYFLTEMATTRRRPTGPRPSHRHYDDEGERRPCICWQLHREGHHIRRWAGGGKLGRLLQVGRGHIQHDGLFMPLSVNCIS